jgi:hypothetical protein
MYFKFEQDKIQTSPARLETEGKSANCQNPQYDGTWAFPKLRRKCTSINKNTFLKKEKEMLMVRDAQKC